MSMKWPGGLIRKTPVTPAGPLQNGAAPGMWTLGEAAYWTKQGLWPIAGNFLAVEDVFSTYLYTGNGSTQTITNGIDLAGKGGLVWLKRRDSGTADHWLADTTRGSTKFLLTNATLAELTNTTILSGGFTSSGFGLGNTSDTNTGSMASWTFRKAPNFFDVVTYTGDGVSGRTIPHNLGVAPGCIIVKRLEVSAAWAVFHRSLGPDKAIFLSGTNAATSSDPGYWNSTNPSATTFTVGNYNSVNQNGGSYIAYLFAHDATSDGIIQCGSYTGNGSSNGPNVTLGWEPQWLLIKQATSVSPSVNQSWYLYDNMRGMPVGSNDAALSPNTSGAEQSYEAVSPTATGFQLMNGNADTNNSGTTYIYIAIRRGPMRTPTVGTTVFSPAATSTDTATTNFPVDLIIEQPRTTAGVGAFWGDRLRGSRPGLLSASTNAETAWFTSTWSQSNTGVTNTGMGYGSSALWSFRRAPSFFDEVCYDGTGSARTINHNLGVAPELIIVKERVYSSYDWMVQPLSDPTKMLRLNTTAAQTAAGSIYWNNTAPTASVFSVGAGGDGVNQSGGTYVAYLFASCPGVSKVGSYTGTGTTQTINCGFTTGARFVLIKRTDSTGDWYVWDSARGIVAGNDPYLLLNSTAAEVTSTDYIDTDNSGFQISSTAPAAINANGGSYIFLAVA